MSGNFQAVALDLSIAFGRVQHSGLLQKFKSYEILGWVLDLISSFLSNRQLQVVLDGKSSQECSVNAGVPEAPFLCPTLFNSDIPDNVVCNIVIYTKHTRLKYGQASDLLQQVDSAFELEFDLRDTVD